MHRFMVNIKVGRIFNRIFEIQKSTRNTKNNAKIHALGTSGSSVYQAHINQIELLTRLYLSLKLPSRSPDASQRGPVELPRRAPPSIAPLKKKQAVKDHRLPILCM
jgi:hypothetical protein